MPSAAHAPSPLDACTRLFDELDAENLGGDIVELVTAAGDDASFWTLIRHLDGTYRMFPRHAARPRRGVLIQRRMTDIPAPYREALTAGVPLPRDGSLFGWIADGEITAAIAIRSWQHLDEPTSIVSLRTDAPESQWPPCWSLFGKWFWDGYHAKRIVNLAPVLARTTGQVFFSSHWHEGVIAVSSPIVMGVTVPAGVYAYHQLVRSGIAMPSLKEVIADDDKIDLGPEFR